MDAGALCGAKTRENTICKRKALCNGRCHLHGGKSTGPRDQYGNQNARKHGIYSRTITKEEQGILSLINLGSVDEELVVSRIQLRRALIHQAEKGFNNATHLAVDRLLGRIGSLERVKLSINPHENHTDPTELARQIHEAIVEIEELMAPKMRNQP